MLPLSYGNTSAASGSLGERFYGCFELSRAVREYNGNIIEIRKESFVYFFCNVKYLVSFIKLIIHVKKLLDSDCLRAVQFKCHTSAISVTPVQITTKISEVSPKKIGEP